MPSNIARVASTVVIWSAFTVMMLWGKSPNLNGADTVIITAILGLVAAIGTGVVWRFGGETERSEGVRDSAKLKRSERSRARAARLADALDDEDAAALWDELNDRLAVRQDGEDVPLEALLQERDQKAGRR